jgi:hypothetical protein
MKIRARVNFVVSWIQTQMEKKALLLMTANHYHYLHVIRLWSTCTIMVILCKVTVMSQSSACGIFQCTHAILFSAKTILGIYAVK